MIAASTYLPSTSSSTIAASSIHGTGAQNFSIAIRNGCMLVSGIALAPNFFNRPVASAVDSPFGKPTLIASTDFDGAALPADMLAVADTAYSEWGNYRQLVTSGSLTERWIV